MQQFLNQVSCELKDVCMPSFPEQVRERILTEHRNVRWLPDDAILRTVRSDQLPPLALTSSAFALCFKGESLLLVFDTERGWDIPGGHLEKGEDILAALNRELREEACAEASQLRPFAKIIVELKGPPPKDYSYPTPISCMAVFISNEVMVAPFRGEFETSECRFFTPAEVRASRWGQKHKELYEEALQFVQCANRAPVPLETLRSS